MTEHSTTPLSGCRVLDLTDDKGMLCSRLLADMGAEVIRVEKPGANESFRWENLGKRSITLDIEAEAGKDILRRLVKNADVLLESHPPGHMSSLGLGYPDLRRINHRLVVASITDFGQNGPYRDYKSCDLVTSAMGGQMYVNGEPDKAPLKPFGNQTYYTASIFAATGIMLALWHWHTTGKGQHIDISLQECAAATLDHVMVRYFYEGVAARRQGSLYWNSAFRIFPSRDGYILLSLFHRWETLVEWLDSEGMAQDLTDKRWLDREKREKNIEHIIAVLERWTRSHTADELVEKGQLMRFPWAKVTSIPELLESQQLKERDFWLDVEHPETGKRHRFPGAPCKLSRSPWHVGSRVPGAGEHNKQVYGELGLSEEEMRSLARKGII
ncbi:MAG: CoA transferase [Chloroflexi bacterium]|nr:CoA transferase [Chloroflexota bacterium]